MNCAKEWGLRYFIIVAILLCRYQSNNNGSFPSLNLTHKEVGGSFYTVREIVREIIQENRVLGPGQFCSEQQKDDTITLDYPLGTISSAPQGILFQTANGLDCFSSQEKETGVLNLNYNGQVSKHFDSDVVPYSTEHWTNEIGEDAVEVVCQSTSENIVISDHQEQESLEVHSNGLCLNVNKTDSVRFVNHLQNNGTSEESDKHLAEGSLECETFETDGESERTGTIEATIMLPTEKVQVETFPLRPATKEADDLRRISCESGTFDGSLDALEAENVKLINSTPFLDNSSFVNSSDLVTIKGEDSLEVSVASGSPDVLIENAEVNCVVVQHREVNLENESVDMPESFSIKDDTAILRDHMNEISQHGDSTKKTTEQSNLQVSFFSKFYFCVFVSPFLWL